MTRLARISGIHVTCADAGRNNSVVTRRAGSQRMRMIKRARQYRGPDSGVFDMTGIADIGGIHVCQTLAAGCHIVVTTDAVAGKTAVFRRNTGHRQPVVGGMTGITFCNCRNMGNALAGGYETIVTTRTQANDILMINRVGQYRCPCGDDMTGIAHR